MKYSFIKGLLKSLKVVALFVVPVLINAFIVEYPEIAQLTLGGILVLAWNFLKVKSVPVFRSI